MPRSPDGTDAADEVNAVPGRKALLTGRQGPGFIERYSARKPVESEAFARIVTPWKTQTLLEHV